MAIHNFKANFHFSQVGEAAHRQLFWPASPAGRRLKLNQAGMTMIEILIVVVIIVILALAAFSAYRKQLSRARDGQRKSDLEKIRVAFEDYHNDHGCYPDLGVLNNCGQAWGSYLKEIPCDPTTEKPYQHYALEANECAGYRVLAQLENLDDPGIVKVGCDPIKGCGTGYEGYIVYNYGIAMGGKMVGAEWRIYGGMGEQEGVWYLTYNESRSADSRYQCQTYTKEGIESYGCVPSSGIEKTMCSIYAQQCNSNNCSPAMSGCCYAAAEARVCNISED